MYIHRYIAIACISTTVISQPDNVTTICEGEGTVFSCVLNATDLNINNSYVQWYRLLEDTNTTEMVDPQDSNIHLNTSTIRIKSYTGYYWVRLPFDNICNVSLTVLTSM